MAGQTTDKTISTTLAYIATAIIGAGVAVLPVTSGGAARPRITAGTTPAAVLGPAVGTPTAEKKNRKYVLKGRIDPRGASTSYFFEYGGTKDPYLNATPISTVEPPASATTVEVTSPEVEADANERFRLNAYHAGGALVSSTEATFPP